MVLMDLPIELWILFAGNALIVGAFLVLLDSPHDSKDTDDRDKEE